MKSDNAMKMEMAPPSYRLRMVEGPLGPKLTDAEKWRLEGNAKRALERDEISPGTRAAR